MQHVPTPVVDFFSEVSLHPAHLRSEKVGLIHFPTGKIVVSDPILTGVQPPFEEHFPADNAEIWKHMLRDEEIIAYVEVRFSTEKINHWKLATQPGQNPGSLKKGEIFGFMVESNVAAVMDAATQQQLNEMEAGLQTKLGKNYRGLFDEILQEYFQADNNTFLQDVLIPLRGGQNDLYAFESGYGAGFYGSYIGYTVAGEPSKLIIELVEVKPS